jgi:hypothetical protein
MKKYFSLLIVICSLFICSSNVLAQQAQVKASIDKNKISVGEPITLIITAQQDDQTILRWPLFTDSIAKSIELIRADKMDTIISEDKKKIEYKQLIYITSFDSGAFVIPSFTFYYMQGNDSITLSTDSFLIECSTVPVDTTQAFKDIIPPLDVPFSIREILPYIIVGVVALIVIIIIIYLIRKYLKNRPVKQEIVEEVIIPAHVTALEALQELESKKLWQQGLIKNYYVELTDILRQYLFNRYTMDASEMTTDEILNGLRLIVHQPQLIEKLQHVLSLADLVKFAKAQPIATDHEQAMQFSRSFIEMTAIKNNQA